MLPRRFDPIGVTPRVTARMLGDSESEESWSVFFHSLKDRGGTDSMYSSPIITVG